MLHSDVTIVYAKNAFHRKTNNNCRLTTVMVFGALNLKPIFGLYPLYVTVIKSSNTLVSTVKESTSIAYLLKTPTELLNNQY